MSLKKILEEINTLTPFANEDVNQGPVETLSGRRGRKRQAEEKIKDLREQYAREMLHNSAFMIVNGALKDEFSTMANTQFSVFTVDSEEFYRNLANRIPEALYMGKEAGSNLFDIVGRHLEDMAVDMGILGYPMLTFKQQYQGTITSRDFLVELLKKAVNDQVGTEIVGIFTVRSLVDKAIASGHNQDITPIILNTKDEALAISLNENLKRVTRNTFLLVIGKAPRYIKNIQGAILVKDAEQLTVESVLVNVKNLFR